MSWKVCAAEWRFDWLCGLAVDWTDVDVDSTDGKVIAIYVFCAEKAEGFRSLKNPLDSRDYAVHFGCKSPCLSVAISEWDTNSANGNGII
jgi:hypothetical protein